MSLTDEDKRWITAQFDRLTTQLSLKQDAKAWEEGFKAGEQRDSRCPYRAGSNEAWSWHSGFVEGAARPISRAL